MKFLKCAAPQSLHDDGTGAGDRHGPAIKVTRRSDLKPAGASESLYAHPETQPDMDRKAVRTIRPSGYGIQLNAVQRKARD
jgi:hypothetical protein